MKKRRFKKWDIVSFSGRKDCAARKGSLAFVRGYRRGVFSKHLWLEIVWIRDTLVGGQSNGQYEEDDFELMWRGVVIKEAMRIMRLKNI